MYKSKNVNDTEKNEEQKYALSHVYGKIIIDELKELEWRMILLFSVHETIIYIFSSPVNERYYNTTWTLNKLL